jgi:hypothetical protein
MARKSTKSVLENNHSSNSSEVSISNSDIAALAYKLWQERGCPEGSPDEDWYEAQRKLQSQTDSEAAVAGR